MLIVVFVSHRRNQSQEYRNSTWKKWTNLRLQERKTRQIRNLWDIFKANKAKEQKAMAFWVLVATIWSLDCIKKLFTAKYRNILLHSRYAMKYLVKTLVLLPLLFFNIFGNLSQVDFMLSFIPTVFFEHLYPIGKKTKLQKKM